MPKFYINKFTPAYDLRWKLSFQQQYHFIATVLGITIKIVLKALIILLKSLLHTCKKFKKNIPFL